MIWLDYYEVPTKYLNQQVRRNILRFPEDFLFRLTAAESANLRLQFATSSSKWGGRRYWPMAFTQVGVGMLSSVLSSPRGVEVNIAIMRAFVKMSNALTIDAGLTERMEKAELALEALESEQGEQAAAIHEVMAAFRRLTDGTQ